MANKKYLILIVFFITVYQSPVSSAPPVNSLLEIQESKAYRKFENRPPTDLSKILYLIERFEATDMEVNYSGHYYKAHAAALIARFFLATHYKKETVSAWVILWCHRSIDGQLIYVRYPNGKFSLSRDILIREWKNLELVLAQTPPLKPVIREVPHLVLGAA